MQTTLYKKIITSNNFVLGIKNSGSIYYFTNSYVPEQEKQEISNWNDIVSAILYSEHTILAVKSNGELVASDPESINCYYDILNWKNVKEIIYHDTYFIALKIDGTIDVSAPNYMDLSEEPDWCKKIKQWTNISHIIEGERCLIGLKTDGTVAIVSTNFESYIHDLDEWKDIQYIACYKCLVVGVRTDGNIVISGKNVRHHEEGISFYSWDVDVSNFNNIKSVEISNDVIVGIQYDGKVIYSISKSEAPLYPVPNRIDNWDDMQEVSLIKDYEGTKFIIGVKNNGEVVASHFMHGGDLDIQNIKEAVIQWNLN